MQRGRYAGAGKTENDVPTAPGGPRANALVHQQIGVYRWTFPIAQAIQSAQPACRIWSKEADPQLRDLSPGAGQLLLDAADLAGVRGVLLPGAPQVVQLRRQLPLGGNHSEQPRVPGLLPLTLRPKGTCARQRRPSGG